MNTELLAVLGLSGGELVLVLVVILVLFGAKKIPEFAKGLGQGIKEFKKASNDVQSELQRAMEEQPQPPKRVAPAPEPVQPVASVPIAAAAVPAAAPAPAPKAG